MSVFVRSSHMPAPARELADWHFRAGAIDRLIPPWEDVEILERPGAMADGAVARFRMRKFGVGVEWVARHHDVQPGRSFSDTQERGPFARWVHRHSFLPDGDAASMLEDRVDYDLPGGFLGRALGGGKVEGDLARMFAWRHARTRHDLGHHAAFPGERLRVAVSGGNGLVGGALVPFLTTGGHDVRRIVRGTPNSARGDVAWDTRTDAFDTAALEGLDAVVHLAGAGIADRRWTAARKAEIVRSRVEPTRSLCRTLAGLRAKPRVLVCASAIGWYGNRPGPACVDETSARGDGFLAETCEAWERATDAARDAGIRVVNLRIGVVLSARGGALAKLLPPFRMGLGGAVGSGEQGMSWIDLDDLLGAIRFVMSADVHGGVNAVAPEPCSNRDFGRALGAAIGRPAVAPLPSPAVKAMFGEMGERLLLEGAYVRPARLSALGFRWALGDLGHAFRFETGNIR
jgi:uncharacterized protein (TIGR01777 family)